jgi:hypothetical protein
VSDDYEEKWAVRPELVTVTRGGKTIQVYGELEFEAAREAWAGGNVQPGDVLSMEDAGKIFGYGPGSEWSSGGSPDPRLGLGQFLGSRGLTPQQYQAQYGGLPFVFNPDGTVTFDPAARKMHFHMRARPHGKNKSSPLQLLRWPLRV